jgi:N-acetylglucosamine malate deacetylase 2
MRDCLQFLTERRADSPRILVVSPHPDDEVIGAGTRLPLLRNALVVQVTDGAPADMADALAVGCSSRAEYAALRHRELKNALALCGVSDTIELNIPDQEAAFDLNLLTEQLETLVRDHKPEYIITVPYEGGHPDHDATAFAVHQACARLAFSPAIIEMLSYHSENGSCVMDRFLEESSTILRVPLSSREVEFKKRLFQCFASQARVLKWFRTDLEKFRLAPSYNFSRPPHDGQLYYEMFPWGMTSQRWCELASHALARADALVV